MATTKPKTQKNDASVSTFIDGLENAVQREDARALTTLMTKVTGEKPKMWGKSIVGFGQYHYRYPTGREADWLAIGFSPRAQTLTLYLMAGFGRMGPLLDKLGKHTTAKSCLHIKRLSDVDPKVLAAILRQGLKEVKALESEMAKAKATPKKKPSRTRAS